MVIGIYYAAPLLGPSLGPILGGTLTQVFGWRANFWLLAAFLGLNLVLFVIFFRETFRCERSVTYRRAAARRNSTMIPRPSSSKGSNIDPIQVSGVLETASKGSLGDKPNLVSSDGGATWDGVQEGFTPSLVDINPFPPLLLVLRRWNNVPTLISSGTTQYLVPSGLPRTHLHIRSALCL
jgi:MFS family permease